MAWSLSAPQCFFIAIVAFGVIGFIRGWRRELISLAFILGGILFLFLGGGTALAHFVFVRVPVIFQEVLTPNPGTTPRVPAEPSSTNVFLTIIIFLVVMIALGYLVGNRVFPRPTAPADRILGVIPGLVVGYALMTYITYLFANSPFITVGVNTPSQSLVGNYMLILFIIAVVLTVIGLVAASAKKSGGAKPK